MAPHFRSPPGILLCKSQGLASRVLPCAGHQTRGSGRRAVHGTHVCPVRASRNYPACSHVSHISILRTRWTTLSHPLWPRTTPPALPPFMASNHTASPPGGPNLGGIRMRRDRMNADNVCTGDAAVEIATASLALTSILGCGQGCILRILPKRRPTSGGSQTERSPGERGNRERPYIFPGRNTQNIIPERRRISKKPKNM